MTSAHPYISVMGTMGSGKTTVARLLARSFRYQLLEEQFGPNAFLERFYKNMKRWAFHSQSFFLMEKITQMLATPELLRKRAVIQDTPIQQDVYSYAKAQHVLGNMDDSEWRLYQKIYHSFEPYMPVPDMIVYLETTQQELLRRIGARGRGYERKIPKRYVALLDRLNHEWLTKNSAIPVLTVHTDGFNVVTNRAARLEVADIVRQRLRIV